MLHERPYARYKFRSVIQADCDFDSNTMISGIALVTIVGVLFTTLWVSNRRRWKVRPPYPPGPRAEPILGHLRAVPSSYDEGAYREMGDKYGTFLCRFSSEVCFHREY